LLYQPRSFEYGDRSQVFSATILVLLQVIFDNTG